MRIRVPASSANLGSGFDCFGIAWDVYNTIDLIELKGRKYHSKKNNYNSFAKKYDFVYKKFSSAHIETRREYSHP